MFENDFAAEGFGERGEGFSEDISVLCDDAGERNDEDDAAEIVFFGVAEGEEER